MRWTVLGLLLSACCSSGGTPPPAQVADEAPAGEADERVLCERFAAGDRGLAERLARIGGSDQRIDMAAIHCRATYGIVPEWWTSPEQQQAFIQACRDLDSADVSVRVASAEHLASVDGFTRGGTEQSLEAAAQYCHLQYDLAPSWMPARE